MRLTGVLQKIGDVSKKFANFPDAYVKRSMEQVSMGGLIVWQRNRR